MSEAELLKQIREYWPKFVISKENLLRPTQELVFQFYSKVIEEHDKTLEQLTGVFASFDFNYADCEPEEQLFLKISRLLGQFYGLKFTLADIYQPTAIRTKNFFKVCIHLAAFIEYLRNEEDLGNEVFKAKEDMAKLLLEQQELIDETNENAKIKAELIENQNLIEQELKSTRAAYGEMKSLKASKEKLFAEKRNQIESLKMELQNDEYELKRLENMEKDLLEQKITEREHQHIVNTIKMLKTESEVLDNDNIDIGDGLVLEDKVLEHSADCIRILNKCDFNVANVKNLIRKEEELKIISNTINTLTSTKLNPAKQQKLRNEQKLATLKEKVVDLQSEYKTVKETYTSSITLLSRELNELKEGLQDKCNSNLKTILDYKRDIEKLEENLDKMKKTFTTEYIKVSKVEKMVVDKFKDMLMKFKQME